MTAIRYPIEPQSVRAGRKERGRKLRENVSRLDEIADGAQALADSLNGANLATTRSVLTNLVRQVGVLAEDVAELARQVAGEAR